MTTRPHFIDDATYTELQDRLRAAALTDEWRGAMAEALALVDVLPACCAGDFPEDNAAAKRAA